MDSPVDCVYHHGPEWNSLYIISSSWALRTIRSGIDFPRRPGLLQFLNKESLDWVKEKLQFSNRPQLRWLVRLKLSQVWWCLYDGRLSVPGLTRGLALFSHKDIPGWCTVEPETELVALAFPSGLSDTEMNAGFGLSNCSKLESLRQRIEWIWSVTTK